MSGSKAAALLRRAPACPTPGAADGKTRRIAAFETERVIGVASSETNYEFSEAIALRETGAGTEVTLTMGFEPTVWWTQLRREHEGAGHEVRFDERDWLPDEPY